MNFDEMQENPDIRATKNGAVASEKILTSSPLKSALPVGGSGPHVIHSFLGPSNFHLKWHLDWFMCFCRLGDAYGF